MKVLVVDDNQRHRAALVEQLSSRGQFVSEAASGKEALTSADDLHPDVLLLDMRLPDLDGGQVAQRIRAKSYGAGVYIIALTANAFDSDRRRAIALGCDWFVSKPYDIAELMKIIVERPRFDDNRATDSSPSMAAVPDEQIRGLLHDLREWISVEGASSSKQDRSFVVDQLTSCLTALGFEPAASATPERTDGRQARRTLLIVENDFGQRGMLEAIFRTLGYEVSIAGGVTEAKAQIAATAFDAYIIDLRLGADSGVQLAAQLSPAVDPQHNVVFASVAPSLFLNELKGIKAARVYDKNTGRLDELIRLVHEVAPVRANVLVSETAVVQRGRSLIADIRSLLERGRSDVSVDSEVASLCQEFARTVQDDPSIDINKYLLGSDVFVRCLALIDGPLMSASRRVCLESYWLLRARWLFGTRRYLKWSYLKLWGTMTGFGESLFRIGATLGSSIALCLVLMATKPEVFAFSMNGRDLAGMALGERWWSSIYIATCHALLVSTETSPPLSAFAQAMVLGQTMTSVVMLALYVGTVTSRLRQDH
jgi:two-component system cell cycle response regulator DivK